MGGRQILAVGAVLVAVLLCAADGAVASGPGFPYAELAAEGAAVAPPRIRLAADAAVRLRPALTWPVVVELTAGDLVTTSAVTPGGDRWLRIGAGEVPQGWMRVADSGLDESALEHLPLAFADPIRADMVRSYANISSWPGGPTTGFKLIWRSSGYAVVGRSADADWIAVTLRDVQPPVAWVRAEAVRLRADDLPALAAEDLPIFIGRGTTVLPLRDHDGRAAVLLPPAHDWLWTGESTLVGVGEQIVWRYAPARDDLTTHARPPGRVKIAPDGRHIAVSVCAASDADCGREGTERNVVIVSTDGGPWATAPQVLRPLPTKAGILEWVGHWSPDGRMLLVPRHWSDDDVEEWPGTRWQHSVVTLNGARSALPQVEGMPRCYWRWLPDGSLINCAGGRYSAEPDVTLLQANAAFPEGWSYVAGQRSLLGYVPLGSRLPGGSAAGRWSVFDLDSGEARPPSELDGLSRVVTSARSADGRWAALLAERAEDPLVVVFDRATGKISVSGGLELPGYVGYAPPMHVAPSGDRLLWLPLDGDFGMYAGVHVVDLGSGQAAEVDLIIQSPDGHVCGGARNWSPDGEQFTLEVFEFTEWHDDGLRGRDGLAAVLGHHRITQIRIYNHLGGFARAFRAPSRAISASLREVAWSPDGRWMALGESSLPAAHCAAAP